MSQSSDNTIRIHRERGQFVLTLNEGTNDEVQVYGRTPMEAFARLTHEALHDEDLSCGAIDMKYVFGGYNPYTGSIITENDAILFKASDRALFAAMNSYLMELDQLKASAEVIEAIKGLIERLVNYQERSFTKVPDMNSREVRRISQAKGGKG